MIMAGVDTAGGNAGPSAHIADLHARRPGQSDGRAGAVCRVHPLQNPRYQRELEHRSRPVVGLHPDAERGRHRPLQSRQCRSTHRRAPVVEPRGNAGLETGRSRKLRPRSFQGTQWAPFRLRKGGLQGPFFMPFRQTASLQHRLANRDMICQLLFHEDGGHADRPAERCSGFDHA